MKKSSFATLVLGIVSSMLFALGMCMVLLPEWNAFQPGIILGCAGVLLGLVTVFVWRKMTKKAPIKLSGKAVLAITVGMIGTLLLGTGMCFVMVWDKIIAGILIGVAGIIGLLFLIPILGGLKD